MASYLFTFNPENRDWGDARLEEWKGYVRKWEASGCYEEGWTCGNTKRILEGDRAFMVKVGKEPRGIIASGFVTQHAKEYENGVFVRITFDVMLDPEQHIFPLKRLHRISQAFNWTPQKSGRTIPDDVARRLEKQWRTFLRELGVVPAKGVIGPHRELKPKPGSAKKDTFLPEEADMDKTYSEGARMRITVNRYERDPEARRRCIECHGIKCSVCKISLEELYGEIGKGYIHVHHIRPLSECGKGYEVDPVKDLRPVCPNCHAMIHRKKRPFTIEQMRKIVEQYRNRRA